MAVEVGTAIGYLDIDITGYRSGLASAESALDTYMNKQEKTLSGAFDTVGQTLTDTGSALTKYVTVPLTGVGVAGLKVATDFEKNMSNVKAISGATGEEFKSLRDEAISLGASTAFSANEVANAMTEMSKAGWGSQQILEGMGGVLDAAAASGEDLATVSTIVADAITGFGMEASESTKVADLLTQAANSGTIGITDLGESFKYVAPVAGSLGVSIEDTTTALSAMSMAGIKGSQAGTSLRTMLTNMVKPTDNMALAMQELGFSVTDSKGNMKSLDTIVSELRTSFDGLTEAEKAKYAATIAGKEGMSGMLALLNLTEEEYNKLGLSMDNAKGVAQETATVMQDNLGSKVEQLGGSLESLAIKLSDYVIPWLTKLVTKATEIVDSFTNMDESTQKTILKIAGVAVVAGPAILTLGKLITTAVSIVSTFSKLKTAFVTIGTSITHVKEAFTLARAGMTGFATQTSTLGAVLGGITAPVAAIIAGVVALVAAFATLWNTNEEFRNNIIGIWEEIKTTVSGFLQGIVDRINSLGFDFQNITEVLKAIWFGFCDVLAPVFTGVFQFISDTLSTVLNVILGVVDFFIAIFKGDWQGAWDAVKGIFETIWNGIKDWFTNILETIKGVFGVVCSWFGTTWDEVWTGVKDFFSNIWNNIVTFFTSIPQKLIGIIKDTPGKISNFFKELPEKIGYFFGLVIGTAIKWGVDLISKARETGSNFLEAIVSFFKNLPENIATWFTNTVAKALAFRKSLVEKAKETGSKFLENLINFIKNLPTNIATWFTNTVAKVTDFAVNLKNKAVEAGTNLVNGIIDTVTNLPSKMEEIGKNIVTGLINGITNMTSWVSEKIKGFADGLTQGLKDALDIHSPSRVMRDEVGRNIALGVIEGIKSKKKAATKASGEMAKAIVDAAQEKWDSYSSTHSTTLAEEAAFWKSIANECKKGSDAYNQALAKYKSANDSLKTSVKDLEKDYKASWKEIKENLSQDIQDVVNSYNEALTSRVQEIKSQTGSLFDAYERKETEDTKESLTANLQSQIDAVNEWDKQMTALSERKGVSNEFLEEVRDLGVDATEQIRILNSMTDEELANYLSLWAKKNADADTLAKKELSEYEKQCEEQIKVLTKAANKELNSLEKEYNKSLEALGVTIEDQSKDIGQNIVKGLKTGIKSEDKDFQEYLTQFFEGITHAAKNALDIHSPSRVFRDEIGVMMGKGVEIGFAKSMTSATKGITTSLNSCVDKANKGIGKADTAILVKSVASELSNSFLELSDWFMLVESRISKCIDTISQKVAGLSNDIEGLTDPSSLTSLDYLITPKPRKSQDTPLTDTPKGSTGGDTYNFYSQAKLSEVECRHEMIQAKKELALEF